MTEFHETELHTASEIYDVIDGLTCFKTCYVNGKAYTPAELKAAMYDICHALRHDDFIRLEIYDRVLDPYINPSVHP